MLGMQLGRHFHQAASGQALQQRAETADGVAIVGFLAVGFMFGTVGDLRVFDWRCAFGASLVTVVILKQQRRQLPAQVLLDIVGEHAKQCVTAFPQYCE